MTKKLQQLKTKVRSFARYRQTLGLGGTIGYSLRRLFTPSGWLIPVRVRNGGKLYLRNHSYDTVIFSQIFIYRHLDFNMPSPPKIIIDCGANIGLATLFFKFKYPGSTIISVEPESSNFEVLKKNTKSYDDVHLIKKGIWNSTAKLFIIDNGEGEASFQVSETPLSKNVVGQIDAIAINDILHDYKLDTVDLLKMDIEGSEYECFNADNKAWIERVKSIAVEIHEHMRPGCTALIDKSLAGRQYQLNGEYHLYTQDDAS